MNKKQTANCEDDIVKTPQSKYTDEQKLDYPNHGNGKPRILRQKIRTFFLIGSLCFLTTLMMFHIMKTDEENNSIVYIKENENQKSQNRSLNKVAPIPPDDYGVYDVAVIGSGPAGLSAAIFIARSRLSVIVLGSEAGGLLSETPHLENFPGFIDSVTFDEDGEVVGGGGPALVSTIRKQAESFGTTFANPALMVEEIKTEPSENPGQNGETLNNFALNFGPGDEQTPPIKAKSVIVATGAQPRRLNLENEDKLWGNSLHNCALCDAPIYDEKTVVVVGGGDAAVDAAILLSRHASKVIVVHRRNDFRAKNIAAFELMKQTPNVEILTSYNVKAWKSISVPLEGNNGQDAETPKEFLQLEAVEIESRDGLDSKTISCDGAFLMIGATPNTRWLRDTVDLHENGLVRLMTGSTSSTFTTATSLPGIFAAGEVQDGIYRQAITAAAQGAMAAIDAERWLRETQVVKIAPIKIQSSSQLAATQVADRNSPVVNIPKQDKLIDCNLTEKACIQKIISENPVVLFKKEDCPYCVKAYQALVAEGVRPYTINMSYRPEKNKHVIATLNAMTGRKTFPNVFIGGKSIGGQGTVDARKNGSLRKMLMEVGAITVSSS